MGIESQVPGKTIICAHHRTKLHKAKEIGMKSPSGKLAADDFGLLFLLTLSGYCFCNRLEDHGSSALIIAEVEIRTNRIRTFFIVWLVSKAKI